MTDPVLAVGLSPAWQQITTLDRLTLGAVNRSRETVFCASGKAINVAIALQNLGQSTRLLSVCGGWSGAECRRELKAFGIDATWIETLSPTRVCTTILDREREQTTELVQNAGALTTHEIDQFRAAYAEVVVGCQVVVMSGSQPSGLTPDIFRELIAMQSIKAVLDIRGIDLMQTLSCRPLVVKPNRSELEQTVGQSLGLSCSSECEVRLAMHALIERGAQWVVVSDGPRATLVSNAECTWRLQPVSVPIVNPIGCGDCLAAGIAAGLQRGLTVLEAVRLGLGAAAENATQLLPARICDQTTRNLAQQCAVEQLEPLN